MRGTIEFKVDGAKIECHVKMSGRSHFDNLMLIESMAEALGLDSLEKKMVGLVLAAGGIEKLVGAEVDKTLIDLSALKKQQDLTSEEK